MRKQREQRISQPKYYDFNSMILAGRPPTVDSHNLTQQDYSSRLKQIRALKRFQQLFKRQYCKQQPKYEAFTSNIQDITRKQSPHQLTNRLKGMFFLRKKAEIQSKYKQQMSYDDDEEEQITLYPPIQGKTVSPSKQNRQKSKQVQRHKHTCIKQKQIKPLNFVNYQQKTSGKIILSNSIMAQRPTTEFDSSVNNQKIFNTHTLYSAILGANKIKMRNIHLPHFSYFSVYVQEGNNSQLIKSAVRKRSGWKVVEIPAVANMVWSQFYKKSYDIKIKYKKSFQKSPQTEKPQQKNQTFGNLSFLSQISIKKKSTQKQMAKNLNLMTLQQYNKQLCKICPKMQHLHRKSNINVQATGSLYFYNHIPNNHFISDKTNLLRYMKKLYERRKLNIFEVMPYSLDITGPCQVEDLLALIPSQYNQNQGYWIIKPGQNSNRGKGIVVVKGLQLVVQQINCRYIKPSQRNQSQCQTPTHKQNLQQIKLRKQTQKQNQTLVLQKYIQPLLYQKRKFDIRMYMLVTNVHSKIRGYVYNQGYVRTSSKFFTMDTFNKFVHLTNDAIQSRSSDYGKFQQGNKISWKKFQKWLQQEGYSSFWPQFTSDYKRICKNILQSVKQIFTKKHRKHSSQYFKSLERKQTFENSDSINIQQGQQKQILSQKSKIYFEVFGLDFLVDKQLKTWLIEVNTNPALTTDCSRVVNSIIPRMIDNAFGIAVQPFVKSSFNRTYDTIKFQNNFQVIFDDQWNY